MAIHTPISEVELTAYVDGEVFPERRSMIEAWLAHDRADADRVESWQRQNEILRAAYGRLASEPLPARPAQTPAKWPGGEGRVAAIVSSRVADAGAPPLQQSTRILQLRREQRARTLLAVAAAFVAGALIACLAALTIGISPSQMTGSLVASRAAPARLVETRLVTDINGATTRRALEAFSVYAAESGPGPTNDVADAGQAEALRMADWTERRLGQRIEPVALAGGLSRFLAFYVTPGEFGPAAFLVYGDETGQKTGIFISRSPLHETLASYADEGGTGIGVSVSSHRGLSVAVVGALPRDRLMQLGDAIQASFKIP